MNDTIKIALADSESFDKKQSALAIRNSTLSEVAFFVNETAIYFPSFPFFLINRYTFILEIYRYLKYFL